MVQFLKTSLRKSLKKYSFFFAVGVAIALGWIGISHWSNTAVATSHPPNTYTMETIVETGHQTNNQVNNQISDLVEPKIKVAMDAPSGGLALFEQGQRDFDGGQIDTAIEYWQQAIDALGTGDILLHGVVLNHMAIAHQRLGQWAEADRAIQQGLVMLETASEKQQSQEVIQVQAQLVNTRGRLEWTMGQADQALETWLQATTLYESIDDATGVLGSQINQVQAMESLGYYRQACDRVLEVLAIPQNCQQLGGSHTADPDAALQDILQIIETQSNPQLKLLGLRSLGNVLRLTGQLALSQHVLDHALDTMPSYGEQQYGSSQQALALLSLAATEKAQYHRAKILANRSNLSDDRALAAQFAAHAIEHYDQIEASSPATSFTGLQAQLQRLALLIELEDWHQYHQHSSNVPSGASRAVTRSQWSAIVPQVIALRTQLPIAPLSRPYPVSRQTVDAYLELTQQLIRLHKLQDQTSAQSTPQTDWLAIAQPLAMAAVTQADQLADIRSQSYAYGILGHIYEIQNGAIEPAQASTLNALGLAQSAQISDITYRWQWQLGRLAEREQKEEEAIAYYEAAVKTLDTVRNNLLNIDADVQFSFRDDVEPIYRRLVELLLAQNNGNPSQEALRQAIHDIDALQLSELENFLGCNLTESVALSDTLVDPTAVVVYPIILKHQLAVITKWPHTDALHLHTVSINDTEVKAKLSALQRELSRPFRTASGLRLSQELYTWILHPVESLLRDAQAQTLVFVLDGKFRNVPMASLHDGEQYVVQRYALALMPGLQLLEPQPLSDSTLDVLTFGLSQMRKAFPPHSGFDDLNNVEAEVKEIKNQLPSRLFLNEEFTQTTLAERIESVRAPIVHLATHGQFSSEPTDTFVLAWDQRIDVNTLSDILRARNAEANPIELLVMSACQTAEGDDRAALGLAGIAVRSGARSTLASLWTVDDKATADMMSQFYRELGQTGSQSSKPLAKAEALRRAQVMLLESEQFSAPRYWAPFILVGNWL